MSPWFQLEEGVYLFRDSCNVHAVRRSGGAGRIFSPGTLNVAPGARCARQSIALDLIVDGHPFGQVARHG